MDFRSEVLFWSKAMHERVGTRTPYQRYTCATASVFIAGAVVVTDAWLSLRRRLRHSRRDRAQNEEVASRALVLYHPGPTNAGAAVGGEMRRRSRRDRAEHAENKVASRELVLYTGPANVGAPVDGEMYGRTTAGITSPAAVYFLSRLLAEMFARQPVRLPAAMPVASLTLDNLTVPDEVFFHGVLGLPPNPCNTTTHLLLCGPSQFPPSSPPPGSILLNRGIDGSMVRPHRATTAPLSVRWEDLEVEEEEEARRRERDTKLSAGGGGGGTEEGSSWAVHPEAPPAEGAPRRWESKRMRLAREAREAAAAAAAAGEEEEEEGASSEVPPEATAV